VPGPPATPPGRRRPPHYSASIAPMPRRPWAFPSAAGLPPAETPHPYHLHPQESERCMRHGNPPPAAQLAVGIRQPEQRAVSDQRRAPQEIPRSPKPAAGGPCAETNTPRRVFPELGGITGICPSRRINEILGRLTNHVSWQYHRPQPSSAVFELDPQACFHSGHA
jgi:hypothetical protein